MLRAGLDHDRYVHVIYLNIHFIIIDNDINAGVERTSTLICDSFDYLKQVLNYV